MLAVAGENLLERLGLELELAQLATPDPPSCVLRCRIHAHEPEEDLAAGSLRARVDASVELLGAAAERADNPARRHVALKREYVAPASREQLGERVLQQRQPTGLVVDVCDDLGDEAWLKPDADALPGP